MKHYSVTLTYTVDVIAENEDEAIERAKEKYGEIAPRPDEITYDVIACYKEKC